MNDVTMRDRIVIIDGNSLINRAYYAMQRPMITKEGIYTQGVYGFINILNKIMDDYAPQYLTVAFDLKAPTFRHVAYDQYKAGRKKMPPELAMQMPIVKEVLRVMNVEILEMEGFEADDIIGTVARRGEEEGLAPLIITGDKDALQLATDVTKILITKKGITDFDLYDHDKMIERYGLTPDQFIDLKGLMGDSSDNIPGIPGVGEKTGIQLLQEFGSVENLIANAETISKPALRTKVEENSQLAVLSKSLATINKNVPIELDFERLKVEEPDYGKLIALYKKLEFNSFLRKLKVPAGTDLSGGDAPLPSFAFEDTKADGTRNEDGDTDDGKEMKKPENVTFADIEAGAKKLEKKVICEVKSLSELSALGKGSLAFIKIYGSFDHVGRPEIEGLCLASDERNKAFYVDMHTMEAAEVMDAINGLELGLKLWGHDIKNDLYALMFYGFKDFEVDYDTAIAEYVLDVSKSKYDLSGLALERLQVNIDEGGMFSEEKNQMDMFSDAASDNMEKTAVLAQVAKHVRMRQEADIEKQSLGKVLYQVEIPLIEVLASMEVNGIGADLKMLEDFGAELRERIAVLELKIYDLAGEEFKINSPKQLGEILFEKLQLPSGKKGKTGYSTGAEVLEKLKSKHPIAEAVLEYRNLTKLNSTYVEGMKPLICKDGRIRAHFQQTVTATGRISCTEPNLQNIPIRQELGRNLRKVFRAGDAEHILVGADYSQIELRVLAHLSQDDGLIEAFNTGQDIHRLTASRVMGIEPDKVSTADRSRAKAVNFGVIYGMSGFGLSEELKITRKDAEAYIEEYFKKHQRVKEYMDLQKANCKERGYSETILGRKRRISEINASNYMVRQLGERLAMNSPIQGSAADIIKLAMIKVYSDLKENFPQSKLVLQVHDELIIDAVRSEQEEVAKLLERDMESAMEMAVKMEAEVSVGDTWFQLK